MKIFLPIIVSAMIIGTATLLPISTTDSTYITSLLPDSNLGGESWLYVMDSPAMRSLARFDLSGIPSGAELNSARLDYTCSGSIPAGNIYLYRVLRSWVETEATWNIYATGQSWASAGGMGTGDVESSPVATCVVVADTADQSCSIPVAVVNDWITGSLANNGFMMVAGTGGSWAMYSDDSGNPPQLVVDYTIPTTPTPTPIPDGFFFDAEVMLEYTSMIINAFIGFLAAIIGLLLGFRIIRLLLQQARRWGK